MQADKIREKFLDFFKKRGHMCQPSAPLATDEPDILFTIAGMVPFKAFFLGEKKPPSPRITSCQLCFRTNDLEKVGETSYHHTLFEMLGNFSFGDYFKEEACNWGLELVTEEFGLDKRRIWVTVFQEDEETASLWKKLGIPSSRIIKKGEEDNFWAMAEVGPCGPDTEIFFDRGKKMGCKNRDCEPGCNNCSRWVELWNLVFMQYRREPSGKLVPLPSKNVDTGMGLERVATVLQGVDDDYQSDLFAPLCEWLKEISPFCQYERKAIRVISDHLRALTFLLEEGILPSNTGRGYVVRRILRRAFRYGRRLGLEEPFLYQGVPVVVKIMENSYPQIKKKQEEIIEIIKREEESFQNTLSRGLSILESIIKEIKAKKVKTLPGDKVFKMYDTYGFPLELTKEIAFEEGLSLDEEGFRELMEKQRKKARVSFATKLDTDYDFSLLEDMKRECFPIEGSVFVGYDELEIETELLAIAKDGKVAQEIKEGDEGIFVLSKTPFYPEGGGQVADTGRISTSKSICKVIDVQKRKGLILHQVKVLRGKFKKRDKVKASVDKERRLSIARSHTATHLLQAALRNILGEEVKQSGSLVEEERLRFDFTYPFPVDEENLKKICLLINKKIRENLPIKTEEMLLEEAEKIGAIALFEEKYEKKVRVVHVGEFSIEVCGGTHLSQTGQMGLFQIISESGVASGVRRIEALCGEKALLWLLDKKEKLKKVTSFLSISEEKVIDRLKEREEEIKNLKEKINSLQESLLESKINEIASSAQSVGEIKVCAGSLKDIPSKTLGKSAEKLRNRLGEAVVALASLYEKKASIVVVSSKKTLPANKLIKEISSLAGGSGGGRWDFAQGGTSYPERINEALQRFPEIVKKMIEKNE